MTRQELYNEFIKLAPFENATDDYRDSLSLALHNVSDVFTQLEDNRVSSSLFLKTSWKHPC